MPQPERRMLWVMAMGDNGGWPYFVGEGTVKLEAFSSEISWA